MHKLTIYMTALAAAALSLAAAVSAAADSPGARAMPAIWIKSGIHSANISPVWKAMRDDTGDPWAPGAPWQTVLSRVKVVEVSPGGIEGASAKELQAALAGMKRAHVALLLGTGLLTRTDQCAAHNEATGAPGELEQMLLKIQRNGGDLRTIAMDEPYYFGHVDGSGCHQSAAALAANVAQSVTVARRIFPNVVIGDIEVLNASRPYTQEIAVWADAYRAATGETLAFMQTDIDWSELAMRNLQPLSAALRVRGIPLAVIYNADAGVQTDEAWGRSTESHIAEIEGPLAIRPDIVVFDSWTAHPRRYLPETAPWTFTNVALRYFRAHASLKVTLQGERITGRLTDDAGRPVAGAGIAITAVDVGARMAPTMRSWAAVTPKDAVAAVAGLRVDSEGACACDGEGAAVVGPIRYQEQGTNVQDVVLPGNAAVAPGGVRTLRIVPGSSFSPNLKQFPVTPGTRYTVSAPIAATTTAEHAGYATIIFLNGQGKGLNREFLWFSPSRRDLGAVTTGVDGRFALALPAADAATQAEIRATFSGTAALRPALAIAEP